jgi:DNA polymerase III subunit alpha
MINYVSLHNHTVASLGGAILSQKELFNRAKELGQSAVAVTDNGTTMGLWDALKASKATGVKLIAGTDAYFVDDINDQDTTLRRIVLLAKNATGYKNLLTLNKTGYDNFTVAFKRAIPRIDWKLLEKYSDGLICLSGCGNGIVGQFIMADRIDEAKIAAKRLLEIFGRDSFALELQPHNLQRRSSPYSGPVNQMKINTNIKKIAEDLDIRCIIATDAHYLNKEDHKLHDAYICISSGQPITSGSRLRYDKHEFYVKSADQVYEFFKRHIKMWGEEFVQSLFDNTVFFSNLCEDPDWIDPAVSTGDKSQLPEFPYKDEPDYQEFLEWKKDSSPVKAEVPEDAQFYRYRSEMGLKQKVSFGKIPQEDFDESIQQMLEEFDVFEYRGFSSYMLITAEFLDWCRANKIATGPGRGSVGGSLTAYVNRIHQAYPKKYDLIFARFLNKHKAAYPDIDNDIAPSGRAKLHQHLRDKYGEDNVAHVSNINTITPKVYARDIARVFEFGGEGRSKAAEIGNAIADSIPAEYHTVKSALENAPLFAEYAKEYPELSEFAGLCGKPRALSTHAGGIVVSKRPLTGLVPLRRDTSGALVLEYEKERAEENGLVKIDTLGLETLDIIGETERLIEERSKELKEFDYELDDKTSYDLVSSGDTFGVFQLASTAVPVCKQVKPKSVQDLALISSLVRPSSKDSIPEVIKVRNGEKDISMPDQSLQRSFGGTYGIGLFEESLLFLAQDFAGWDLHDADKLRKLTKEKGKNPEKVKQWREEFIEGAVNNKGFTREFAEEVWSKYVESFGGYGFNRSLHFSELVDIFTLEGKFITSKPIKDVQPGEYVRSRDEESGEDIYIEVIGNHDHGELEVVEVELETGEKVKCTMNHKFRVQETGEMLPLWKIMELDYSIVVR